MRAERVGGRSLQRFLPGGHPAASPTLFASLRLVLLYLLSRQRWPGLMLASLLALLTLNVPAARAQQVLLQTDVAQDTLPARTGPNRAWFGHLYAGVATTTSAGALGVRAGLASAEYQLGGRLKRRLGGFGALNADLRYAFLRYELDPGVARPAPFGAGVERQSLAYQQLQAETSVRLNFDPRRGNTVGYYLDVLGYGSRALHTSYAYQEAAPGGGQRDVSLANPAFLARWLGGVGLRVGRGPVALSARYRLSPALRPASGLGGAGPLPEPPRLLLGLELGWF